MCYVSSLFWFLFYLVLGREMRRVCCWKPGVQCQWPAESLNPSSDRWQRDIDKRQYSRSWGRSTDQSWFSTASWVCSQNKWGSFCHVTDLRTAVYFGVLNAHVIYILHLTAKLPKIWVWGPVTGFSYSLLLSEVLSVLTLLCKVWEVIQVIWQGSWSWKSVFKVYAWLLGFIASWPFHSCLSTGVDEEFCPDGSACHLGCWTAGRTLIHFPGKLFILGFCKRVQERTNTCKFNVWRAALLCLVVLTITDSSAVLKSHLSLWLFQQISIDSTTVCRVISLFYVVKWNYPLDCSRLDTFMAFKRLLLTHSLFDNISYQTINWVNLVLFFSCQQVSLLQWKQTVALVFEIVSADLIITLLCLFFFTSEKPEMWAVIQNSKTDYGLGSRLLSFEN